MKSKQIKCVCSQNNLEKVINCIYNICTTKYPIYRHDPIECIHITPEILETIKEKSRRQ